MYLQHNMYEIKKIIRRYTLYEPLFSKYNYTVRFLVSHYQDFYIIAVNVYLLSQCGQQNNRQVAPATATNLQSSTTVPVQVISYCQCTEYLLVHVLLDIVS